MKKPVEYQQNKYPKKEIVLGSISDIDRSKIIYQLQQMYYHYGPDFVIFNEVTYDGKIKITDCKVMHVYKMGMLENHAVKQLLLEYLI